MLGGKLLSVYAKYTQRGILTGIEIMCHSFLFPCIDPSLNTFGCRGELGLTGWWTFRWRCVPLIMGDLSSTLEALKRGLRYDIAP